MKTQYGDVIELHFEDGNPDGRLYVRGHLPEYEVRDVLAENSDWLEATADQELHDQLFDGVELKRFSKAQIVHKAHELLANARIEHLYARWSMDANHECDMVLKDYRERGRGRFPVTRAILYPEPPCFMPTQKGSGVYACRTCGKRYRGPICDYTTLLRGPATCPHLQGDETGPFTEVYEELPAEAETA